MVAIAILYRSFGVQPLTNRRTKFVALAFESSGWTDPTVQKLVNVWEQAAGFATFWPRPAGVQRSNTGTRVCGCTRSKSPYLYDGWSSFGR